MGLMPLTSGKNSSAETITTGESGNDYEVARNVIMRGVESLVLTIENTDGSNGITVKATEEFAEYAAGEENAIYGFPANITSGNKGRIDIEKARARLTISIKSQSTDSPATWKIVDTINML